MLGTLRLALALLVAISHADVRWFGLNPGVAAVIGFYVISGYVMTGLVRRHYERPSRVGRFYLDRALRLLPAYYVVACLALLWYLWHGPQAPFLSRQPGLADVFNNLFVVPLNFSRWNDANTFVLVPPAWSLGAEIQFYLLFPWLVFARIRALAFALSLAVYGAAFAGWIHTEWFGYRLLPGVLWTFLAGSWLYDLHHPGHRGGPPCAPPVRLSVSAVTRWPVWLIAIVPFVALGWGFAGQWLGSLGLAYNRETLIGFALIVPLVHGLGPWAPRRPAWRVWDERAGDLAYGVFLVHFLVFWLWPGAETGTLELVWRLLAVLLVSAVLYRLVEAPFVKVRRLRVRQLIASSH